MAPSPSPSHCNCGYETTDVDKGVKANAFDQLQQEMHGAPPQDATTIPVEANVSLAALFI